MAKINKPRASAEKVDFFVGYSRLEFALKDAGYVVRKKGPAYVDWVAFAKEACFADLLEAARADPVTKVLVASPPKFQMSDGRGGWHWHEPEEKPIKSLLYLFGAVKQVRDNLFHGAKAGENPRDNELCKAALRVVDLCLERHSKVRNIYNYRY
jgi:hypothetical protein